MKHIYGVETKEELIKYQQFVEKIQPKLDKYLEFLKEEYDVIDLPRTIIWTSEEIATSLISDLPVPAYTNEYRVVLCPDIKAWHNIYLKQLDNMDKNTETYKTLEEYYNNISENYMLQILGHELAHHSELFLDDFDSPLSNGIWFEEGMVEYISRQYFLTKEEFEAEAHFNQQLVDFFKEKYGSHSLEDFGEATYEGDYASIFFEYWRSFLAIKGIIEDHNGDIHKAFEAYHKWNETGSDKTLVEWFKVNI